MKNLTALAEKISQRNMLQKTFLAGVIKDLPPEELEEFERYIGYCLSEGVTLDYLTECYELIVNDTMEEQLFFRRHKRYRFSSYNEVGSSVYANPDYMSKYMYGLALTAFLWPNHILMRRYFLRTIPRSKRGRYLEIGPGHGFYFMNAMRLTQFDSFDGVDLSSTSVAMTNQIVGSKTFGQFQNYRIYECDAFTFDFKGGFDAIVMGEVLEHVEAPGTLLGRIRALAKPDGFIFITTCINSPAFDHIYLFKSVEHLEGIIREAGLAISDKLILPYHQTTLETSVKKSLPVNVAYVLSPA